MNTPNQYRQGDVLIERVAALPRGTRKKKGRVILAHGEVTGHCHEIKKTSLVSQYEIDEALLALEVEEEAAVEHQEHATINLPPGKYIVHRQREYSPEAIRNVAD